MTKKRFGIAAVCGLAIGLSSGAVAGMPSELGAMGSWVQTDKVVLRNGTVYTGTIVTNTDRLIEIETTVSNIKTIVKIEKWRIREIIESDDVPETEAIDPALRSVPSRTGNAQLEIEASDTGGIKNIKREGYALVLEIPMVGTFGEDIYPKSIAVALEWAVASGVSDVVFRIDSGGGQIWASSKIVDIMERHEDDLRYHGLIESAISASIWPMFECNTINMTPGSDFGGAVVYSQTSTGQVEVDKKMNSIRAAKLASSAEAKGHDPAIVRAMMVSENEVWKYRRAGTTMPWRITALKVNATAPGMEYELVDSDQQILTLTAKQAADLGVASLLPDDSLESFATQIQLGPWDNAGTFGIDASEEWNKKSDRMRDRIQTTATSLMIEYSRMQDGGYVGKVGLSVNTARRKMSELKRYLAQAEDLEMDTIVDSFEGLDLDLIADQIERRQAEIKRVRFGP